MSYGSWAHSGSSGSSGSTSFPATHLPYSNLVSPNVITGAGGGNIQQPPPLPLFGAAPTANATTTNNNNNAATNSFFGLQLQSPPQWLPSSGYQAVYSPLPAPPYHASPQYPHHQFRHSSNQQQDYVRGAGGSGRGRSGPYRWNARARNAVGRFAPRGGARPSNAVGHSEACSSSSSSSSSSPKPPRCSLCNVCCSGSEPLSLHLTGRHHMKKLKEREFRTLLVLGAPEGCTVTHIQRLMLGFHLDLTTTDNEPVAEVTGDSRQQQQYPMQSISEADLSGGKCFRVVLTSEAELRRCVGMLTATPEVLGQAVALRPACSALQCGVCRMKLNSEVQMEQHLKGRYHLQRVKAVRRSTATVHGLPATATEEEVAQLFKDFHVTPSSVHLITPGVTSVEVTTTTTTSSSSSSSSNAIPQILCEVKFSSHEGMAQAVEATQGALLFRGTTPITITPAGIDPP